MRTMIRDEETEMSFDDGQGHGHVNPRPDGRKARCGGPGLCRECSREQVQATQADVLRRRVPTVTSVTESLRDRELRPVFNAKRWPYTYACDLLRAHPEVVPQAVYDWIRELGDGSHRLDVDSRATASYIRRRWAAWAGTRDESLALTLARVYCQENGITVPEGYARTVSE